MVSRAGEQAACVSQRNPIRVWEDGWHFAVDLLLERRCIIDRYQRLTFQDVICMADPTVKTMVCQQLRLILKAIIVFDPKHPLQFWYAVHYKDVGSHFYSEEQSSL